MKRPIVNLCLLLSLVTASVEGASAQIPNGGFEDWTAGNPDLWSSTNSILAMPLMQSADFHPGSSAIAGTVLLYNTSPYSPLMFASTNSRGFAVNSRYPALHGWYKYAPVGGDAFTFLITMTKGGITNAVGIGSLTLTDAKSVYTEFVMDVLYLKSDVPDTCGLTIGITSGGAVHPGSAFVLDDLTFGPSSAVDDSRPALPAAYDLAQNYPNPFNPSTLIQYSIPRASQVRLTVFDILGREIASLVDEHQDAGTYRMRFDGSTIPSGTYFYRLRAGEFSQTKRFLLVK